MLVDNANVLHSRSTEYVELSAFASYAVRRSLKETTAKRYQNKNRYDVPRGRVRTPGETACRLQIKPRSIATGSADAKGNAERDGAAKRYDKLVGYIVRSRDHVSSNVERSIRPSCGRFAGAITSRGMSRIAIRSDFN